MRKEPTLTEADSARPRASLPVKPLAQAELRIVGILAGVSLESVWGILSHCQVLEPEAGQVLISPDQTERTLYFLLAGRLRVYLDPPIEGPSLRDTSPGRQVSTAELSPGQAVGEISVLEARPATAYVVTTVRSRVLAVSEAIFWRLIQASHEFSINLLLLLAHRMRENNRQLSDSLAQRRVLEREVTTDALTGLFNRRWLDQRLPRFVDRHRRNGEPLSVLMLDVDHFKRVNDVHGHAVGDAVLVFVARTLLAGLRPTDMCARYGGEEIAVILPGTDLVGALVAAERVRRAIEAPRDPNAPKIAVTASIGAATLAAHEDAGELLQRADEKLYRAKSNGRNRTES
jgi:diguanylate cyclase (GGDEF)-like protein